MSTTKSEVLWIIFIVCQMKRSQQAFHYYLGCNSEASYQTIIVVSALSETLDCLAPRRTNCPHPFPFYFTYRVWSSIVIVHEKSGVFFCFFFRNISKTAETILIKKIERNHGISVYKKAVISEHPKNVSLLVCTLRIFVDEQAHKLV